MSNHSKVVTEPRKSKRLQANLAIDRHLLKSSMYVSKPIKLVLSQGRLFAWRNGTIMRGSHKDYRNFTETNKENLSPGILNHAKCRPARFTKVPAKKLVDRMDKLKTMEIAIIAKSGTILESHVNCIKSYILDKIDATTEGKTAPKFNFFKFKFDHVIVSCSNEKSRNWLQLLLNNYTLEYNLVLKVIDAKNIPIHTMVWIPGPYINSETILRRFTLQNTRLDTKSWQVISKKIGAEGFTLFIDLDKTSWERIVELEMRPYLNLTRVSFYIVAPPVSNCKTAENSSVPTTT